MNHNFYPYCSDTEKRNQVEESYRNLEKCSVCGKERYGHWGHAFRAGWEDVEFDKFGDRIKKINEDGGEER